MSESSEAWKLFHRREKNILRRVAKGDLPAAEAHQKLAELRAHPPEAKPSKEAARQVILAQLERGVITLEAARAAADNPDVNPLERRPAFDPMTEPDWSLMEAVAWIAWRTPEAVKLFANEYRLHCSFISDRDQSGHYTGLRLVDGSPVSLALVLLWADGKRVPEPWFLRPNVGGELPQPLMSLREARELLFTAGRDEMISGFAYEPAPGPNVERGARVDLVPLDWSYREWGGDHGTDVLGDYEPRRVAVRVYTREIIRLWPELDAAKSHDQPPAVAVPVALTGAWRNKFKEFIRSEVAKCSSGPPEGSSRESYIAIGRRPDYRLPKQEAEVAYKEALTESLADHPEHGWSKPGPKRKT